MEQSRLGSVQWNMLKHIVSPEIDNIRFLPRVANLCVNYGNSLDLSCLFINVEQVESEILNLKQIYIASSCPMSHRYRCQIDVSILSGWWRVWRFARL